MGEKLCPFIPQVSLVSVNVQGQFCGLNFTKFRDGKQATQDTRTCSHLTPGIKIHPFKVAGVGGGGPKCL